MGISRSASTPARLAARAKLKRQRLVGMAVESRPVGPARSWWVGLGRAAFYRQAALEFSRMRQSRFAWITTGAGNVRPAEKERATRADDAG